MRALAVAVAMAGATGCSGSAGDVATGTWGGHNAELVVTSVGATARFKCGATGTIGRPLTLDTSGNFEVPGSFVTPVTTAGIQAARYSGSVSGQAMTLAVFVASQSAGVFQLTLGEPAVFDVCNFS